LIPEEKRTRRTSLLKILMWTRRKKLGFKREYKRLHIYGRNERHTDRCYCQFVIFTVCPNELHCVKLEGISIVRLRLGCEKYLGFSWTIEICCDPMYHAEPWDIVRLSWCTTVGLTALSCFRWQ
jgi:hypothetical protein